MGKLSNWFMVLLVVTPNAYAWDDGLLERVGQSETKRFFTSPWAGELSWIDAQEFCNQAQVGMQMAQIETERERQIVYSFFVSNAADRKWYEFWVSGTDYGSEGNFTYTHSGQPVPFPVKQAGGEDGKQENCLKIISNGAFEDEACFEFTSTRIWPLCELKRPDQPTTTTTTMIPPTTSTHAPTPAPEFECTAEGMHADPSSCQIYHVCVAHQGGFLDRIMNCPPFTNYCQDQQICGHPEDCPCDDKSSLSSTHLSQANANKAESSPLRQVRPKFEKFPVQLLGTVGQKTFYTDTKSRNLNWIESMEFCHQNDMIMARMETNEERNFLLSKLSVNFYIDYFWLSGVDYGTEGSYYWFNKGTELSGSIYGNGGRASNCLYLSGSGPLYDWSCAGHRNVKMWPLCQTTA